MIAVVDYGLGNIRSVEKALLAGGQGSLGVEVVSRPQELRRASAIVLPGVGAFSRGIRNIRERGLQEPLVESVRSGKPFLGICLGLQLLFSESEEDGLHEGLGIISGRVERLTCDLKIPHVGWNCVSITPESEGSRPALFDGIPNGSYFYFVHSYHGVPQDGRCAVGWTEYGQTFVSAIQRENIWAVQFHPEKSAHLGLKMLENFCRHARQTHYPVS